MQLTPREKDKLLVAVAAEVARKRLARGVQLNYPEAIALIADAVVEGARDGRSVADMMEAGAHVITRDQCMEGILVLSRFSSGLFRAIFAMKEIWNGKEIHRRVSP